MQSAQYNALKRALRAAAHSSLEHTAIVSLFKRNAAFPNRSKVLLLQAVSTNNKAHTKAIDSVQNCLFAQDLAIRQGRHEFVELISGM